MNDKNFYIIISITAIVEGNKLEVMTNFGKYGVTGL